MNSPTLIAAFRATTYRVTTPIGVFDLRIGVHHPAFDEALASGLGDNSPARTKDPQTAEWAIVTACNPGKRLSDRENACRQRRMAALIADSGWRYWPAANIADDGQWPVEASFLLLRVAPRQVMDLARRFGQLAIVFGAQGQAPRLWWIDDGEA